jgi:hypothetical protein
MAKKSYKKDLDKMLKAAINDNSRSNILRDGLFQDFNILIDNECKTESRKQKIILLPSYAIDLIP